MRTTDRNKWKTTFISKLDVAIASTKPSYFSVFLTNSQFLTPQLSCYKDDIQFLSYASLYYKHK